jgi:hypothetical protein
MPFVYSIIWFIKGSGEFFNRIENPYLIVHLRKKPHLGHFKFFYAVA